MRNRGLWVPVLVALAAGCEGNDLEANMRRPRGASDAAVDAPRMLEGPADSVRDGGMHADVDTAAEGELDRLIRDEAEAAAVPGIAAALVDADSVLFLGTYGLADIAAERPVTTDTSFMLASISKTFVAIAMMQSVERGEIALDADVDTLVAPRSYRNPAFADVAITPFMLLTHTSSIIDDDAIYDGYVMGDPQESIEQWLDSYLLDSGSRWVASNFSENAPGTVYSYSNSAITLAGYVVQQATGAQFATIALEGIFSPLGMTHTSYRLADLDVSEVALPYDAEGVSLGNYGYPDFPSGLARSSITDMAGYARALLRGGELDGERILEEETLELMFTPQIDEVETGQGLVFVTFDGGYVGHDGVDNGCRTELLLDRARGRGAIVLTNGEPTDEEMVDRVARALLAHDGGTPNGRPARPTAPVR